MSAPDISAEAVERIADSIAPSDNWTRGNCPKCEEYDFHELGEATATLRALRAALAEVVKRAKEEEREACAIIADGVADRYRGRTSLISQGRFVGAQEVSLSIRAHDNPAFVAPAYRRAATAALDALAAAGWLVPEGWVAPELEVWMARDPQGRLQIHHSGDNADDVKHGVAWLHDHNGGKRQPYDGHVCRWEACEAQGWRIERVSLSAAPRPEDQA